MSLLVVLGAALGMFRISIRAEYLVGSFVVCLTSHNLLGVVQFSKSVRYLLLLLCNLFAIPITLFVFCFIFYFAGLLHRLCAGV